MILRAEKGFIVIGKDTDGTTLPHDLGSEGPRTKRQTEYVGRRSLFTEEASRGDRLQLVGLTVPSGEAPLPTGAHGIKRESGRLHSQGFVTSSYRSAALGRTFGLALLERGRERIGETVYAPLGDRTVPVLVTDPVFYDPEGTRRDGD